MATSGSAADETKPKDAAADDGTGQNDNKLVPILSSDHGQESPTVEALAAQVAQLKVENAKLREGYGPAGHGDAKQTLTVAEIFARMHELTAQVQRLEQQRLEDQTTVSILNQRCDHLEHAAKREKTLRFEMAERIDRAQEIAEGLKAEKFENAKLAAEAVRLLSLIHI